MTFQEHYIVFMTIFRKEFNRFMRIWTQTLIPPIITMALYFVIFGNLIGSQIDKMQGFSYMEFIVPGLIMMSVITNSYMNVSSSFFSSKFQRSIEEILVSPASNGIIILGYVAGGVTRGLMVGFLVMVVSIFFTKLSIAHLGVLICFVVLTAIVFSLAGLLNGIFAQKFDDVNIIPTFILTPLTYLGGVFYSIELLSPLWRSISQINPILYMVSGFRYGFLGISDINIFAGLSILILFTIILFSLNLYLLKRGVGLRS